MSSSVAKEARIKGIGLSKHYMSNGRKISALDNVSIDVKPAEMVVLLGPSGCGKTTLLRSIAGLEQPQAGEIRIDDQAVYSAARQLWVPPERRGVSMVFQSYALWPHMTVKENIAFPLQSRKVDKHSINERVAKIMEAVGLGALASRMPSQLSGGQQQRVALARAIVGNDGIVLFDEPLSNVDAQVRDQIRREIVSLQDKLEFSGLYVTHDQTEATALADKLVVMDHGRVAQMGSPEEVYDSPHTRYVATFMGPVNEISGQVLQRNRDGIVCIDTSFGPLAGSPRANADEVDRKVVALFRPEAIQITEAKPEAPNTWHCRLDRRSFMGAFAELTLSVIGADQPMTLTALVPKHAFQDIDTMWAHVPPEAVWVFEK